MGYVGCVRVLYVTAFCWASTAAGTGATANQTNLLHDAGFEASARDGSNVWTPIEVEIESETQDVHSGKQAVRLKAVSKQDAFSAELRHAAAMPVRREVQYLASVWAKGRGRLRIALNQYAKKRWIGGCSSIHTDLTDQWTQYRFFYGTEDDEIDEVRFSVFVDQKDAVALLDDAAFSPVGPSGPPGASVVPNGTMEVDAGSDGVPDGWSVNQSAITGDLATATSCDSSRVLLALCLGRSRPGGAAWNAETWWDWSKQPVPAAGWVNAAASSNFPVEPGRTYEVRFRTRGDGVRGFHAKLYWIKPDGTTLKWFTVGPRHDGDWSWEEVRLDVTVPSAHVNAARIELWARAAGGRLCVDDVSVRPIRSYATGWAAESYDVQPIGDDAASPKVERTVGPAGKPYPLPELENLENRVEVSNGVPSVFLTSGVRLHFVQEERNLLGVSDVQIGDLPWRNPDAPPIAPLVKPEDGGHYVSCRYLGHDVSAEGLVILHTALRAADGQEDRLDWVYQSVERQLGPHRYVGFSYRYVVTSPARRIIGVDDRATWELGGTPTSVTVITQNAYNVENVFTITPDNPYFGQGGKRFAGADGLDYQFAPQGALAVFYSEPISYVENHRGGTEAWLQVRDSHAFAGTHTARTPTKCVLFRPQGDHDAWTVAKDCVYDRHTSGNTPPCWKNTPSG